MHVVGTFGQNACLWQAHARTRWQGKAQKVSQATLGERPDSDPRKQREEWCLCKMLSLGVNGNKMMLVASSLPPQRNLLAVARDAWHHLHSLQWPPECWLDRCCRISSGGPLVGKGPARVRFSGRPDGLQQSTDRNRRARCEPPSCTCTASARRHSLEKPRTRELRRRGAQARVSQPPVPRLGRGLAVPLRFLPARLPALRARRPPPPLGPRGTCAHPLRPGCAHEAQRRSEGPRGAPR